MINCITKLVSVIQTFHPLLDNRIVLLDSLSHDVHDIINGFYRILILLKGFDSEQRMDLWFLAQCLLVLNKT